MAGGLGTQCARVAAGWVGAIERWTFVPAATSSHTSSVTGAGSRSSGEGAPARWVPMSLVFPSCLSSNRSKPPVKGCLPCAATSSSPRCPSAEWPGRRHRHLAHSPGDAQRLGFLCAAVRAESRSMRPATAISISYPGERQLFASTLKERSRRRAHIVLSTGAPISSFWLASSGERIALLDDAGGLHVASLHNAREPQHTARCITAAWRNGQRCGLRLHWPLAGCGHRAARTADVGSDGTTGRRTDGARPRRQDDGDDGAVFEPTGRWLDRRRSEWCDVLACHRALALGPSSRGRPAEGCGIRPEREVDRRRARRGGVEVWPSTVDGFPRRRLAAGVHASTLAVSPDGQFLATGTRSGSVLILPVAGSGFRELRGFQGSVYVGGLRCHRKANRRGWARWMVGRSEVIRVFDLETGDVKSFDPGDGKDINHRRLPAGWQPAHLELWRTATHRFGNRVLRAPARAAGCGIPRSRRPTRPAAPNRRTPISCRYGFRVRPAGAALLAARDPWQPGHADGLGSLRHARRDRQPGWDRAGRSRDRRRAAPPDRPSRTHLGCSGRSNRAPRRLDERGRHGADLADAGGTTAPHLASRRVPRQAALADERSHCPGRLGVHRLSHDVPAVPRVGPRSADLVTGARGPEPSPRFPSSSSRTDSVTNQGDPRFGRSRP